MNEHGDFIRVGWIDNGTLCEENRWPSLQEAEEALLLLERYAIGGDVDKLTGIRVVEYPDA